MESIRWQFYPYVAENPHGRSRLKTTENLLCREACADTREMHIPWQAPDRLFFPLLSPLHGGSQVLLAFAHPIDCNEQVLWATQEGTGTVGWRVHDQARLREPPHEFGERNLGLHARQRGAKADMDATAKAQMLIITALGIKAIRVREPLRVTVACGQGQRDQHTLGNGRPSQSNLFEGGPLREELDWRLIAQDFLHGGRDQIRVVPQAFEDRRMPQQREHPIANQIHGGLMAGDQQQRGGREEVGVLHPSLGVGISRHPGKQIVTWMLSVALDQPGHILVQVIEGLFPLLALLFGLRSQTFHEQGGPHVKLRFIFQWDAQDPANHRHRQGIGEALDEIELALPLHLVEKRGDDAQDLGTQLLQVLRAFWRTKVAHRQPTQAVVLRGVQADKLIRIRGVLGRPPVCTLFLRSELMRGSWSNATISR